MHNIQPSEFLAPGAVDPVNVDSRVAEIVRQRIDQKIDRYCLDVAEEHIFKLMKNDSYNRYARSDMYKELLSRAKKKSKKRFTSEMKKIRDLTSKTSTAAASTTSNTNSALTNANNNNTQSASSTMLATSEL